MKLLLALVGGLALLGSGCVVPDAEVGGSVGFYGEYPTTHYYYGRSYYPYSYYHRHYRNYYAPYDRDHYFYRHYRY